MRLESRIALITGGSGGFGIATCQRFNEEGSTVILADINEERLHDLTTKHKNKSDQIKTFFLDVSNFTQVQSVVNNIVSEYGGIDILVNNAGYLPKSDNWLEDPIKDWQAVINVNLIIFSASSIIVNSFWLPKFTGPVKSSPLSMSLISPSMRLST